MKKVISNFEILEEIITPANKIILDVGCGIGETTRWLAAQNAMVTGIDKKMLIDKATEFPVTAKEQYKEGLAEKLPFEKGYAHMILYMSSFHHIQRELMPLAIAECKRVLKAGGIAVFLEPVAEDNSWYEITKFFEEEKEIRQIAYENIKKSAGDDFMQLFEKFYYIDRSLKDFNRHVDIYVNDTQRKSEILRKSGEAYQELLLKSGLLPEDFSLKAILRLNLFVKP